MLKEVVVARGIQCFARLSRLGEPVRFEIAFRQEGRFA